MSADPPLRLRWTQSQLWRNTRQTTFKFFATLVCLVAAAGVLDVVLAAPEHAWDRAVRSLVLTAVVVALVVGYPWQFAVQRARTLPESLRWFTLHVDQGHLVLTCDGHESRWPARDLGAPKPSGGLMLLPYPGGTFELPESPATERLLSDVHAARRFGESVPLPDGPAIHVQYVRPLPAAFRAVSVGRWPVILVGFGLLGGCCGVGLLPRSPSVSIAQLGLLVVPGSLLGIAVVAGLRGAWAAYRARQKCAAMPDGTWVVAAADGLVLCSLNGATRFEWSHVLEVQVHADELRVVVAQGERPVTCDLAPNRVDGGASTAFLAEVAARQAVHASHSARIAQTPSGPSDPFDPPAN